MSNNKEDSVMGLPTGSGKRRWPNQGEEGSNKRSKGICTSPPHALCAEDVLKNHHPASYVQAASHVAFESPQLTKLQEEDMEGIEDEEGFSYGSSTAAGISCSQTNPANERHSDDSLEIDHLSDQSLSDEDDNEREDREAEEENFIDDEEDKDSGFIDGNSIDNSSDDDAETKESQASPAASSTSAICVSPSAVADEELLQPQSVEDCSSTDLQLSLSKVLPSTKSSEIVSTVSLVTTFTASLSVSSGQQTISELNATTCSNAPSIIPLVMKNGSDTSITTVTAAQSGTTVTSAYQGAVPSPSYDLQTYTNSTYANEMYLARSPLPSWSCNFSDGSHPTPNKYMEISPSRSHANPSIQCDENGKSYLELGSASPYTNTYTTECTNFSTTSSSYNGSLYTQTFTGSTSTYGQGNTYYNTRQNYNSASYAYHNESYTTYENETTASSYSYPSGTYQTTSTTRSLVGSRVPQRCSSPYCDPTRTSPRPPCYPQQRLSVLNMSMYKLNRYSRFPETSLHRSVLIWNTLRQIEKELEGEGISMASILAQSHQYAPHIHNSGPSPDTMPSPHPMGHPSEGPLPSLHSPLGVSLQNSPPLPPPSIDASPAPTSPTYAATPTTLTYHPLPHYSPSSVSDPPPSLPLPSFENKDNPQILRPFAHPHPPTLHDRLPPMSASAAEHIEPECESSFSIVPSSTSSQRLLPSSPEERSEDINWCSVLSLSSQTDLDTMNNNDCHEWPSEGSTSLHYSASREEAPPPPPAAPSWKQLPSLSADDVLKSFPESSRRPEPSEDMDSLINVLVSS